jgi:hypothetical protein
LIELTPTEAQISKAKEMAEEMGHIKGSIRKGEGNLIGFLGEVVCADYYGFTQENTYQYDLINEKGAKIDVKTKVCSSEPKESYLATVFNPQQKCDYYIFCRVLENNSKLWICGHISKKDFFEKATFNKKGEYDETSPPTRDFFFMEDCYNLPMSNLTVKLSDSFCIKSSGLSAYWDGYSASANPYERKTPKWEYWTEGWRTGRREEIEMYGKSFVPISEK